jgi:hypothetical protein
MAPETVELLPPVTEPGDKLEESERIQLENHYLRVVNAQQAYDLAVAAVEGRDRVRREMNTAFIAFRTKLEAKYKANLGPGKIKDDGTIVRPPPMPPGMAEAMARAGARRPLTPADFPTSEEAKEQLTPATTDTQPAPAEASA